MIKLTGAALCGAAISVSAAGIAFNSPVQWGTMRTNDLKASFVVDSSLIGKTIKLTLTENGGGSEKVVSTQSVAIKALAAEVSLPLTAPVNGGASYHMLKWDTGDNDGTVGPFAVAPVGKGIDPNAVKAGTVSGALNSAGIKASGSTPVTAGTAEAVFGWNPGTLAIALKGTGTVSVTIDPDNSKSAFRAFSDRTVTVDFDKNTVLFDYKSRKAKDNAIIYTSEKWNGEMKGTVKAGSAEITIPWYELGLKAFAGRQMGIMVQQGESRFPAAAQENNPSTWGNILLK